MLPIEQLQWGSGAVGTWTLLGRVPFALWMAFLFRAGLRRGWSWREALLVTGALAAGLSAGVAVLPDSNGAILGGIAFWLLAQRVLRLRESPLFEMASASVLLLAVGRVACFLTGCCFGAATSLPWAVHYGPGSAAWLLHASLGWIDPGTPCSLGVHPIQLYESVAFALWLPALVALRPRLRSEGALVWLTGAFLFALRSVVVGLRGMVNVWWSLNATALGIDPFRLALAAAAFACVLAALWCERRAPSRRALSAEASPFAPWLLYASLCAAGLLTDAAQTPILHVALLATLVAALPALRLPATFRLPRWAGPALGAAALLPLLHAQVRAQALAPAAGDLHERRWLYDVDARRGVLVRVGNALDSPERVERIRLALDQEGFPPAPAPEPPAPPQPEGEKPREAARASPRGSIGLGGTLGSDRRSNCLGQCSGCSGTYQVTERSMRSGWLRGEWSIPAATEAGTGFVWIGGRGGYLGEDITLTGPLAGSDRIRAPFGQAWAEYEFAGGVELGLALQVAHLQITSSHDPTTRAWLVLPGGRLRAGSRRIGLDVGFLDRASHAAPGGGHAGISGTFAEPASGVMVNYSLGLELVPGLYSFWRPGAKAANLDPLNLAFGAGLEIAPSRRWSLGIDVARGTELQGTGYFRIGLGALPGD